MRSTRTLCIAATDTAGDEEREEELGGVRLRRLYLTCIELMCMFATGKELGTHLLRVLVLPPSIRAVQDPFAYINTMARILALCPQSARDVVFDEVKLRPYTCESVCCACVRVCVGACIWLGVAVCAGL